MLESHVTSDDRSTLTKLEDILASGMFRVMHLVKGILILELRLSVPGEDRLNMTKLSSKECSKYTSSAL